MGPHQQALQSLLTILVFSDPNLINNDLLTDLVHSYAQNSSTNQTKCERIFYSLSTNSGRFSFRTGSFIFSMYFQQQSPFMIAEGCDGERGE